MGDKFLENRSEALTKPIFQTPAWAKASTLKVAPLTPNGPVGPEDLVDSAGRCAATARAEAPAAEVAAPAPPAPATPPAPPPPAGKPAYGSVAGDLASAPMPQASRPAPMPVVAKPSDRLDSLQPDTGGPPPGGALGGIALGMTECDAVRRAGQPNNVNIGAGDKGARKVTITYLAGSWPGIYTFESGRLKEIDAAPVQPKSQKPAPKKPKRKTPPKTAATEHMYVQ